MKRPCWMWSHVRNLFCFRAEDFREIFIKPVFWVHKPSPMFVQQFCLFCFVSPGQHSFLTFYILFFRWSPLLHSHCSPHLYPKLYSPRLWQCKHTTTPWWTRLVRMQTSYKKLWLGRMHYDLMYVVWKKKTHYCHSLWSLSSNDLLV